MSLRIALERGIEAAFQLEDSELSGESLPDDLGQGRMLFTESAEGGAGVLRRLVAEPEALARAARQALEVAHFDPDTGADLEKAPGASDKCTKACYDCLLSYSNQLEHESIDRHLIRDLLLSLTRAHVVEPSGSATSATSDDTGDVSAGGVLVGELVDFLRRHGYVVPRANTSLIGTARPDYIFEGQSPMAIFVGDDDGSTERGVEAEDALLDLGWGVWRLGPPDQWAERVAARPDVFGRGRN